jgi:hypothetical protein
MADVVGLALGGDGTGVEEGFAARGGGVQPVTAEVLVVDEDVAAVRAG